MGRRRFAQATNTIAALAFALAVAAPAAPQATSPTARRIVHVQPANGSTIEERRPEISATFPHAVHTVRVRVHLDGRDETAASFIGAHAFSYQPTAPLAVGKHTITLISGAPAAATWSFTVVDTPRANAINGLTPVNGSHVAATFDVTGYTERGSRVKALATWNLTSFDFAEGEQSAAVETTADARGYFAAHIVVTGREASLVDVRIASVAPDGAVAVRTLRFHR